MGWRFRRSKVFGPLRLTTTKSGLSLSAGGPFGRVSVNTRGQVRETTRVPGVGLYQTRQVATIGGGAHTTRPAAPVIAGGPVSVTAVDATAGVTDLDPASPGVVSLRLVSLVDPTARVAQEVGITKSGDGFTHGSNEGLLMAEGSQWHAFVLIHHEDNPRLAAAGKDAPALAMHVGRLSAHDTQRWATKFGNRPIHVALFIEATPGMELIEARFRPAELDDQPEPVPTSTTGPTPPDPAPASAPLPAAGWYADTGDPHLWRWWDGAHWTEHTAPR